MSGKITYTFQGTIWQHSASGGWYFVSLPPDMSAEIRSLLKWQEEGWGRLQATASVFDTSWDTAIWFDSKGNTYILPLKAAIRKKHQLETDQLIEVQIQV